MEEDLVCIALAVSLIVGETVSLCGMCASWSLISGAFKRCRVKAAIDLIFRTYKTQTCDKRSHQQKSNLKI
jgi:hypothetical protein